MKISTALDYIDSQELALPEFQRGYVWNRSQVRSLMQSLYRNDPVGTLLIWTTEADPEQMRKYSTMSAASTDARQTICFQNSIHASGFPQWIAPQWIALPTN